MVTPKIEVEDYVKKSGKRKSISIKEELKIYQTPGIFTEGVCVFAKMRGHREWPAVITGTAARNQHNVIFFGTDEIGTIPISGLYLYCEGTIDLFSNAIPKKRTKKAIQYDKALREIEEYLESIY